MLGYHGTTDNIAKLILKDGFIVKSNAGRIDDHWLGHGIYFFDELDPATYWGQTKAQKVFKNKNVVGTVLEAELLADKNKVFDLDKNENVRIFLEFYNSLQVDSGILSIDDEDEIIYIDLTAGLDEHRMGKSKYQECLEKRVRCFVCDLLKKDLKISIIIRSFDKYFPKYEDCVSALGILFREKQICVNDVNCISNIRQL